MRNRGFKCLLGNHDQMYLELCEGKIAESYLVEKFGHAYTNIATKISKENKRYIESLPRKIEFDIGTISFAACHGSLDDLLNGRIYPDTEIKDEDNYCQYNYVVLGHTHHKMIKKIYKTIIINPGSLGQQRDGKGCSYVIYDTDKDVFDFKMITYDVDLLLRDIDLFDNGNSILKEVLLRKS